MSAARVDGKKGESKAARSDGADKTFTTPKRPLKLSVSPRRTQAAMRACFTFKAASTEHPVAGATVRFAHHTARTSRRADSAR